jgi:Fe-S-cluster containining protein
MIKTVQETCKQCGMCCTAITLADPKMTMDYIKTLAKEEEKSGEFDTDCQFIRDNWEQITVEEVLKLRPDAEFLELFKEMLHETPWFRCKRFNLTTKRCTVHEIRPSVCKGFPNYHLDDIPQDFPWYTLSCGYRKIKE